MAHKMLQENSKMTFDIRFYQIREPSEISLLNLSLEKFFSQSAHSACHAEHEKAKHARTAGAARKFILS